MYYFLGYGEGTLPNVNSEGTLQNVNSEGTLSNVNSEEQNINDLRLYLFDIENSRVLVDTYEYLKNEDVFYWSVTDCTFVVRKVGNLPRTLRSKNYGYLIFDENDKAKEEKMLAIAENSTGVIVIDSSFRHFKVSYSEFITKWLSQYRFINELEKVDYRTLMTLPYHEDIGVNTKAEQKSNLEGSLQKVVTRSVNLMGTTNSNSENNADVLLQKLSLLVLQQVMKIGPITFDIDESYNGLIDNITVPEQQLDSIADFSVAVYVKNDNAQDINDKYKLDYKFIDANDAKYAQKLGNAGFTYICFPPSSKIGAGAWIANQHLYGASFVRTNTINSGAFKLCSNLRYVNFASNVPLDIRAEAFKGTGIRELKLLCVKNIGESAFENCGSLNQVYIKMPSLQEVSLNISKRKKIDSTVNQLEENADISKLNNIGKNAFKNCVERTGEDVVKGLKSVFLVNVQSIGDFAFANCEELSTVVIQSEPDFNYDIGISAFENTGIEEVNLTNVAKIGTNAFKDCKKLTKITLPKSLPKGKKVLGIGAGAFEGTAITEIVLPPFIPKQAKVLSSLFNNCNDLKDIYWYIENPSDITNQKSEVYHVYESWKRTAVNADIHVLSKAAWK